MAGGATLDANQDSHLISLKSREEIKKKKYSHTFSNASSWPRNPMAPEISCCSFSHRNPLFLPFNVSQIIKCSYFPYGLMLICALSTISSDGLVASRGQSLQQGGLGSSTRTYHLVKALYANPE